MTLEEIKLAKWDNYLGTDNWYKTFNEFECKITLRKKDNIYWISSAGRNSNIFKILFDIIISYKAPPYSSLEEGISIMEMSAKKLIKLNTFI